MSALLKRTVVVIACMVLPAAALSANGQEVAVLYPKDNSIVGNRVNVVLDPTEVPYFQVTVNGTEHPVIDTSRGAHAYQGLALKPGRNEIMVSVLVPDSPDRKKIKVLASRTIKVFSRDGALSPAPVEYSQQPFHMRERESTCASCHRLTPAEQDSKYARPEDVLCFICHREMSRGKNVHGPAAVWNCLACHDPDLYPARYSFTIDPWKVVKSVEPVEPAVFTVASDDVFRRDSSLLTSKSKAKDTFSYVLDYLEQNPGDKVRIEVHTDNVRPKRVKTKKGKWIGFKDNLSLSRARAKNLAAALQEFGVSRKRIVSVGMGEKLPKAQNSMPVGKDMNNRIEIVIHPPDVRVANSQKLPVLKDRERVVVTLTYGSGQQIQKLRVLERMPAGLRYVKGTSFLEGKTFDPTRKDNQLVWELGSMNENSTSSLKYVLKKSNTSDTIPPEISLIYFVNGHEQTREFDPNIPVKRGLTVPETCSKCHEGVMSKTFKHGPVDAGYCNLCHDPHASPYRAWLRLPPWQLCTTCHSTFKSGVHVIAGFVRRGTHPTRSKRDPARPGKHLSCVSCHAPHAAESRSLLAYSVRSRTELCGMCHKKK